MDLYVGQGACPPEYPTITFLTPSSLENSQSGPQNQPRHMTAVSVVFSSKTGDTMGHNGWSFLFMIGRVVFAPVWRLFGGCLEAVPLGIRISNGTPIPHFLGAPPRRFPFSVLFEVIYTLVVTLITLLHLPHYFKLLFSMCASSALFSLWFLTLLETCS